MISTSVKTMHYLQTGAPQLPGTAASLNTILKTALVNGFGLTTLSSLTVQDGVGTATTSSAFPFDEGSVALLAGSSAINGERRVLKVLSPTQFTIDAEGVADGPVSGTITAKMAPLGWLEAYSSGNTSVYTSAAPDSTHCYVRVDDSTTTNARAFGYESMTNVDTGTGQFPLASQMAGGTYWGKSATANATVRPWLIFGDDRTFYIWVAPADTDTALPRGNVYGFGDLTDVTDTDLLGCFIAGSTVSSNVTADPASCMGRSSLSQTGVWVPRDTTNIGGSRPALRIGGMAWNAQTVVYSGAANYTSGLLKYPNRGDNSLILTPVYCQHDGQKRGTYPGVYHTPQEANNAFNHLDQVPTTDDLAGRRVLALKLGQPNNSGTPGVMFFDATGPWR